MATAKAIGRWWFALGAALAACTVDGLPDGDPGVEADDPDTSDDGKGDSAGSALRDPGSGPWMRVPPNEVRAKCRLDPAKLAEADAKIRAPYVIVRYGYLCHEFKSSAPAEAWSATKTLGATVVGAVAYRTRGLTRTARKTGPLSDMDRVDHWLDSFSYHRDARVAHVLGMVATSSSLGLGSKRMSYDALGWSQINTLSDILTTAIRQDPIGIAPDLERFTQRFLFGPLGMSSSTWTGGDDDKNFAYSWKTTAGDMARLGLLLLHRGVWSGRRVLDAHWVYRMTHPSFEDANTGYGYLTWLNSASNFHYGGILGSPTGLQQGAQLPGPCAPVAVNATFPHGASDSPSCNYRSPATCAQPFDVGVWQAIGLGGQVIQGHPGLDMVIVGRDVTVGPFSGQLGTGNAAPKILWDAIRPAVVAADPTYLGDEPAFCAAYGANEYAPDLVAP